MTYYLLLDQLKYEKVNSLLLTLTNHGQDIKQINYVCPGYTVHIPPLLSGYALELRVVYERYILGNHSLSITYTTKNIFQTVIFLIIVRVIT